MLTGIVIVHWIGCIITIKHNFRNWQEQDNSVVDNIAWKTNWIKLENFNYLNVAFISYKLTMWDLMLFSGCHTWGQRLRKKDSSC